MKWYLSVALILVLLASCVLLSVPVFQALALEIEPLPSPDEDDLLLHVGSPIALSGGQILPLDPNDPDLAPFIHKNRTLAPLRMIAEHFGAVVDYDAATKTALITADGKTAAFPIGRDYFSLDGERISLDTETLLVGGRAFVPLRAVCEQVLGLEVGYDQSVVRIGETATLTGDMVRAAKAKIGMFVKAASLSRLQSAFAGKGGYSNSRDMPLTDDGPPEDVAEAPQATPAPLLEADADTGEGSADHSATNVQVEGVDEGDIVKTDGTYVYVVAGNRLKIVKTAQNGGLSLVSSVEMDGYTYVGEMYVDKDRVVVVGSRYEYHDAPMDGDAAIPYIGSFTFVNVYDTSDIAAPKLIRNYAIQGNVAAARKKGDYLYLVTNYNTWYSDIDPRPFLIEGGKAGRLALSDIMIAPDSRNNGLLTVAAVNIRDAGQPVSEEAITGGGYVTYMSNEALYIAMPDYQSYDRQLLNIARFSLDGAKIGYSGSAAVEGSVNDQFSIDEYEGRLRLATTVWDNNQIKNNLYILDENMDVCGSIQGFAPDERIYSARFMGARGYVVTFRQTDPLFVFDLSDPQNPKIVGELKVPGFSSYLHPISENVLLGFGRDVYDVYRRDSSGKEVVVGQQTGGLKVSLFDVSDAGKPREIDTLILGDYGGSELLYNHKAAMFKKDESLLAFPAELYVGQTWETSFSGALLVSYKDGELSEYGRIPRSDGDYDYSFGERLVYIGNTLYYMQGGLLRSFDLTSLKPLQTLSLSDR